MDYKIISDKNSRNYKKLPNGTYYSEKTSDEMIELLESIHKDGTRCRFHWGDSKTGIDWGDVYDVKGHIGRSTGSIKVPLLIYNSRSTGGGAILTDCIVKIVTTKGNKVLYQYPNYHTTE